MINEAVFNNNFTNSNGRKSPNTEEPHLQTTNQEIKKKQQQMKPIK